MIIPCIDLMDGKVVQLIQGREKVLERSTAEMLHSFEGFPQIQVIDLDAAMGRGSNDRLVEDIARCASIRAGGGVRTVERAEQLIRQGAYRVIVGTAAFSSSGPDIPFLESLAAAVGAERLTLALDSRGRPYRCEWLAAGNRVDGAGNDRPPGTLLLRLPLHLRR